MLFAPCYCSYRYKCIGTGTEEELMAFFTDKRKGLINDWYACVFLAVAFASLLFAHRAVPAPSINTNDKVLQYRLEGISPVSINAEKSSSQSHLCRCSQSESPNADFGIVQLITSREISDDIFFADVLNGRQAIIFTRTVPHK
jgi:hypothetical protein